VFELIVALLVVGALLLFIELFVPGMIAGVIGGLALLGALALTYSHYGVDQGNVVLGVVLAVGMIALAVWMHAFPRTRLAQRWMLKTAVPEAPERSMNDGLTGCSGRAVTTLRPAGIALIENRRIDVVAESAVIEAGAAIHVVRVEGPKVVVRADC
jgi:membrane-bound serine protease (ClpP class)